MKNKGIYLVLLTALISGVAVFLNKFAVVFWSNSSVFTTAKNLIVTMLLVCLVIFVGKLPELKNLSKKDWLRLVAIGFIGGSVPFLLFFKGLTLTSATNAAFIHKTLFIWVALLAVPFLKEKLSKLQIFSLGLLVVGTYLFAGSLKLKFGYGEFLILLATLLWAAENIVAKIALRNVSSLTTAWGRMFFGSIFLMIYLGFSGGLGKIFVPPEGISWLALSSVILFGYVITWYAALKSLPATVASAILVIAAPITALLDSVFVTHRLKPTILISCLIIALGTILIIRIYERAYSVLQIRLSS